MDTTSRTDPPRQITTAGTVARLLVGVLFLVIVVVRQSFEGFSIGAWVLGLVCFPLILLGAQWLRTRFAPGRFVAVGPVAHVLNIALFFVLFLTPWYAPVGVHATSDAALLFYGISMLIAATRGYAGCEVLALSNWLLGRDDQVGCMLFAPVDYLSGRRRG